MLFLSEEEWSKMGSPAEMGALYFMQLCTKHSNAGSTLILLLQRHCNPSRGTPAQAGNHSPAVQGDSLSRLLGGVVGCLRGWGKAVSCPDWHAVVKEPWWYAEPSKRHSLPAGGGVWRSATMASMVLRFVLHTKLYEALSARL